MPALRAKFPDLPVLRHGEEEAAPVLEEYRPASAQGAATTCRRWSNCDGTGGTAK